MVERERGGRRGGRFALGANSSGGAVETQGSPIGGWVREVEGRRSEFIGVRLGLGSRGWGSAVVVHSGLVTLGFVGASGVGG